MTSAVSSMMLKLEHIYEIVFNILDDYNQLPKP